MVNTYNIIIFITLQRHHRFIQSSVFSLKMDALLPQCAKIPFLDTELLNLQILFAVSTVFMIILLLLLYLYYTISFIHLQTFFELRQVFINLHF